MSWDQVKRTAQNRVRWRKTVEALCSERSGEDYTRLNLEVLHFFLSHRMERKLPFHLHKISISAARPINSSLQYCRLKIVLPPISFTSWKSTLSSCYCNKVKLISATWQRLYFLDKTVQNVGKKWQCNIHFVGYSACAINVFDLPVRLQISTRTRNEVLCLDGNWHVTFPKFEAEKFNLSIRKPDTKI